MWICPRCSKRSLENLRSYDAENHGSLPWDLMTKADRWSMKQVPDWLRRAMGLQPRFNKGHSLHIPFEVESCFNDVLERMLSGSTRDLQSASNLKMPVLVETAQRIQDKWKKIYSKACQAGPLVPSKVERF